MEKCQHLVPCICLEYLDRLTEEQLENLRIEFGRVLTINDKYNSFRQNKKEADRRIKVVNGILSQKFSCIIV